MNKDAQKKKTRNSDKRSIEQLKDLDVAESYLQGAFESYFSEGDTTALLLALRSIVYAQGGIGKLAKQTGLNREHLYSVLAGKHNPRLDNLLAILSSLGFRIRVERHAGVSSPAAVS